MLEGRPKPTVTHCRLPSLNPAELQEKLWRKPAWSWYPEGSGSCPLGWTDCAGSPRGHIAMLTADQGPTRCPAPPGPTLCGCRAWEQHSYVACPRGSSSEGSHKHSPHLQSGEWGRSSGPHCLEFCRRVSPLPHLLIDSVISHISVDSHIYLIL